MFLLTYERIICEVGFNGEGGAPALCQLTATFLHRRRQNAKREGGCQDLRDAIHTHELNCRLCVESRQGFFQPFSLFHLQSGSFLSHLLAAFSLR